jgi:hypothetical protein
VAWYGANTATGGGPGVQRYSISLEVEYTSVTRSRLCRAGGVRIEHARHRLEVACSFELCCDCEHVVRLPGCRTASCLPRRFLLVGDWSAGEKMRIACVARLVQADAASCGGLAGANLTRVWGLVAAPKRAFARTAPVFGGKSAPVDCRQQRQRRRDAAARN